MSLQVTSRSRLLVCCVVIFSFVGCGNSVASKQGVVVEQVGGSETKQDTETPAGSGAKQETTGSETKPAGSGTAETAEPKAEEEMAGFDVNVAGGAMTLKAPGTWKNVKPRFNMIEAEIKVPKSEGEGDDEIDGRLTVMGAMGSVDANLARWYGQYSQPDGQNTADVAKVTKGKVNDFEVAWVDIKGTLLDRPGGPMAGGKLVKRENYRTLAAIVQAGAQGQYFIKFYGPGKTVSDNEQAFKSFVESITMNAEAAEAEKSADAEGM